jgi:hypothetical protein
MKTIRIILAASPNYLLLKYNMCTYRYYEYDSRIRLLYIGNKIEDILYIEFSNPYELLYRSLLKYNLKFFREKDQLYKFFEG